MSSDLLNLDPQPRSGRRESHARLKLWTRQIFSLSPVAALTVNEHDCSEPECPGVETVVGISVSPGHWSRLRLRKPAALVTREDLESLT